MSYLQTSNWHYFFQIDFKDESWVVVYDLGGGAFDVSVLRINRGVIKVMATAGDNHLGGQDFVDNMMKHCFQEITEKFGIKVAEDESTLSDLRLECEQAAG